MPKMSNCMSNWMWLKVTEILRVIIEHNLRPRSLQQVLETNKPWHWRIYIDVILNGSSGVLSQANLSPINNFARDEDEIEGSYGCLWFPDSKGEFFKLFICLWARASLKLIAEYHALNSEFLQIIFYLQPAFSLQRAINRLWSKTSRTMIKNYIFNWVIS